MSHAIAGHLAIEGVGPPDDDGRAPATGPTSVDGFTKPNTNGFEFTAGLRRRRAASYRLQVLDSGRSDPWYYDPPESSERAADGYTAAAQHLIAAGLLPAPDLGAMRVMWCRDAEHRDLASYIAGRWGVAA